MAELKKCSKCNKMLPIEQFNKRRDKSKVDGHWIESINSQCRECISQRKTEWKRLHPDYLKEYHELHRVLKPVISKVCVYCNKEFTTNKPNQIHCTGQCKPMTPIRKLKAYLKAHPEIDRTSFFKARYKDRYKQSITYSVK